MGFLFIALIAFSIYNMATMPKEKIDWNNISTWGTYSHTISVTESDWEEISPNKVIEDFNHKYYKAKITKLLLPKIKPGRHAAYVTNNSIAIKIPEDGHYLIAGVYNYGSKNPTLTVDGSIGLKYDVFHKPKDNQLLKVIIYRKKTEGEKNVALQKNLARATNETH